MRALPVIIAVASVAGIISSCKEERQSFVANASDVERVPTMTTRDVETFISDSGYTRYHISTPLWEMYDEAKEPHWRFPDGLRLEQYDEQLHPAADIVCDSAIYLSRRRVWQLDGHVLMVNTDRDSFITQQLFWDQNRALVYSDSFIHIVKSDRIIEGYGFESNQNMTAYTVHRPTGIIPVERPTPGATSAPADSSAPADAGASPRRSAPVRASERQPAEPSPFQISPTPEPMRRTQPFPNRKPSQL